MPTSRPLPGERQVVDAPVDHGQQQLPEAGVGRHGPQRHGHHLAHRRVRARPAASTRLRRSVAVTRPGGSPSTISDDTRWPCMRRAASVTVSAGAQVTSGRVTSSLAWTWSRPSGAASLDAARRRRRSPARRASSGSEPRLVPEPLHLRGGDQVGEDVLAGDRVPQVRVWDSSDSCPNVSPAASVSTSSQASPPAAWRPPPSPSRSGAGTGSGRCPGAGCGCRGRSTRSPPWPPSAPAAAPGAGRTAPAGPGTGRSPPCQIRRRHPGRPVHQQVGGDHDGGVVDLEVQLVDHVDHAVQGVDQADGDRDLAAALQPAAQGDDAVADVDVDTVRGHPERAHQDLLAGRRRRSRRRTGGTP